MFISYLQFAKCNGKFFDGGAKGFQYPKILGVSRGHV